MHTIRRKRAFSLVEILVVIGVIALLIGVLVPTISRSRERARRVHCASNLRQIGQALIGYASQNRSTFPRIRWEPSDDPNYVNPGFVPATAPSPWVPTSDPDYPNFKNDTKAGLFLLIRTGLADPKMFVCPSTDDEADDLGGLVPQQRSNFTQAGATAPVRTLSYTYATPYPDQVAINNGFRFLSTQMPSDYALVSDKSLPRCDVVSGDVITSPGRPGNSRNHNKDGQNVLYADGRVEWHTTNRCGPAGNRPAGAGEAPSERDNIFSSHRNNSCNPQSPHSAYDSVIQE